MLHYSHYHDNSYKGHFLNKTEDGGKCFREECKEREEVEMYIKIMNHGLYSFILQF
jgi:hypothetical protein